MDMSSRPGNARRFFIWTAILALCLDQVSKVLAKSLLPPQVPQPVLGQTLRFVLVMNKRGLFGMSYGPVWVHYALPLIGVCLVAYLALRSPSRWSCVAYGLVLAGGIGNNLIDRVRLGSVIDFIDFGMGRWRWYTFNLADAFVVVGVIMLLGHEFLVPNKGTATPEAADPEAGSSLDSAIPLRDNRRRGFFDPD